MRRRKGEGVVEEDGSRSIGDEVNEVIWGNLETVIWRLRLR